MMEPQCMEYVREEHGPLAQRLHDVVCSSLFQYFILAMIVLAAIVVGLETSETLMASYGYWLKLADSIILYIFVIEAIMKMGQHGKRWYRYFKDPWNIFDFSIVAVCFLPFAGHFAAVLRLARVLRALRLVTQVPKLQLLVVSLLKSMPSMGYIGILLLLLFYIYAVMGVFLWRENDPIHFGTLGRSMLSLFRVVTLEDWTDLMYIQMWGSDAYPFTPEERAGFTFESKSNPVMGAAYFISFVLFGTMIMLNLFIGVILNSMHEAQDEEDRKKRQQHIDEAGIASLDDEIVTIEKELEELSKHLRYLRGRMKREIDDDYVGQ